MTLPELLLFGLLGWTAIGVIGSLLSGLRRSNWPKARRGLATIVAVWVFYLATLLTLSAIQRPPSLPVGHAQCFGQMCYAVTGVEPLVGYGGRGNPGERLLRVTLEVRNRAHSGSERDTLVRSYLLDAQGHRWQQLPGLGGIPLTATVPAGGRILSQPVFAVPSSAGAVSLVLTRGSWQPGLLVLGGGDSLLHRPVRMQLGLS